VKCAGYVASVLDEIIVLSVKIGIPQADGSCPIGKFIVEVASDKKAFSFWREGCRAEKETIVSNRARTLSVSLPNRLMTIDISDLNFPSIDEIVWPDCGYPSVEITWIGWSRNELVRKGALNYARVELDGTLHLSYQKKGSGEGFLLINPRGIKLFAFDLPIELEKTRKLAGVRISQKIKFDAKMKKIFCQSESEELLAELRISVGEEIT
jgi:hypothetical protein